MRFLALLLILSAAPSASPAEAPRTLLAVFAHPDDETLVAPLLAAYARRGVRVQLAIVTDGEKGTQAHAAIPAGPELAKREGGIPWSPTDPRFLTVRVPYEAKDLAASRAALACHKSQFRAEELEPLAQFMDQVLGGRVYLRPWFGAAQADDVF